MSSQASAIPSNLDPSQLGTKQYWDSLYTTEIQNHSLDPTDEGTIWFDDSSAESKILSFLSEQITEHAFLGTDVTKENCSFLDLGTGNGHLLFVLRGAEKDDDDEEDGEEERATAWGGRMLGVDYSEQSIGFAKRIAQSKGFGPSPLDSTRRTREVEFKTWDLMSEGTTGVLLSGPNEKGWDVVLDKGTFDAISLSEDKDEQGRRICEGYKERVKPLIGNGGMFLVTSCNWTEEELRAWFDDGELEFVDTIKYRSFSFGGRKGQTISSACFRKCAVA